MEICKVCGKTFKDRRGLAGHMQLSHSDAMPVAGSEIAGLRQAISALTARLESATTAKNTKIEEGDSMESEVMTKKDYEIEKLKEQLAKRHGGGVAVADDEAPVSRKDMEIERLKNELEQANAKTAELPSWFELYEHTKGCRSHSKEFAEFREQVLSNLSKAEVEALAKRKGVDLMPDKIVIGEALARRLRGNAAASTSEVTELACSDGRKHKFQVFKSPSGLAKPECVTNDVVLGKKYVDLASPLS